MTSDSNSKIISLGELKASKVTVTQNTSYSVIWGGDQIDLIAIDADGNVVIASPVAEDRITIIKRKNNTFGEELGHGILSGKVDNTQLNGQAKMGL